MCEKFELNKMLMEGINNFSIEKISIEKKVLVYRKDIQNILKEKNITLQDMEKVLGITTEEKKFNNRLVYDLGKNFKLDNNILKKKSSFSDVFYIDKLSENHYRGNSLEINKPCSIRKMIQQRVKPLFKTLQENNLDANTPIKLTLKIGASYRNFFYMNDASNLDKYVIDILIDYNNAFYNTKEKMIDDSIITTIETHVVDKYSVNNTDYNTVSVQYMIEYDSEYMKE